MPNIKSAKKRVITSAKKCEGNTVFRSSMKTSIKKTERAIKANNKEMAQENLNAAIKRIDKAQSKGLINKNKAAREKSRLTKQANALNK